jgi:hypothetical protein
MNYSLGNMLSRGGVSKKPVISGFAYPEETLTSTRAAQWSIDGVPVSGQTGSTFVVPLLAYGRVVRCGSSDPVTVWKPWDIAGVVSVRVADRGVLNAVSPDVVATNGQTVRRWNGQVSNQPADQTVGVNQPIFRSTGQSGNPSVEFDGINDVLFFTGSELNIVRAAHQSYIIVGCRDTNPTGGEVNHLAAYFSTNIDVSRLSLSTRTSLNQFAVNARRQDGDVIATAGVANNSDYNVLTAYGDWSNGFARLRVNGVVAASAALPSSGPTSDTASSNAGMGAGTAGNRFPGHLCCMISVNLATPISATNLSRLERFAGLFGGLNIPLV